MALEFEGAGAPIVNRAIGAIIELRVTQAALERLNNRQMEETYRGLLAAMVLSAETNAESPAIQNGKPAAWYSEFTQQC